MGPAIYRIFEIGICIWIFIKFSFFVAFFTFLLGPVGFAIGTVGGLAAIGNDLNDFEDWKISKLKKDY